MESGPESTTRQKVSSTSQTGGYKKRPGSSNTSGQDYEVALCCLIFLRALRHASDFFIASNYAPAGQFDDVVLFYRTKEDTYRAILLQAKHKQKTFKTKLTSSKIFPTKEYFDSYKKIKNFWEQSVNVQDQLIEFHEISLVLYTNARCETPATADDVTDSPDVKHLRDILDTGGRLRRISDAEKVELTQDPETSNFIKKVILCTQQMSVQMSDQILLQEIIKVLRLSSLNVAQNIVSKMKHVIKKWWEEKEGRYLSKQSLEWTKIIEDSRLNGLCLNIVFSDTGLEEFNSISGHKKCWVYIRDKYHAAATRLRLLKALRSCLLLDSKLHKGEWEEVEVLWGTDAFSTLLLDTSEDSLEDLSLLLQRLQMAASTDDNRHLVVVSTEKQTGADWIVREAQATWPILDPATQEKLLSVLVDLQGKVVALRDVIGLDASLIMSEQVILALCDSEKGILKLGASFPSQLEYYVPRCMQRIRTKAIKYDTLKKTRTLIFSKNIFLIDDILFGGFKVSSIRKLKATPSIEEPRVVFQIPSDSEIRNLCCRLCVTGFSGVAGAEGLNKEVIEFIPFTFQCKEEVVVVEGVPGVGKSSFVTDMCSRVKERFPECWVVRVDMGKHSEFIRERDFTIADNIKAFLLLGLPKDLYCLAKNLVEHSLYVTGNVFLFLDAFDEISPDFTTKCCDLLKRICKMVKYRQLVVTTRPVTTKQVEEALGTKAFHLPVFSGDEQRLFLERYCKTSRKNVNDEEMAKLYQSVGPVLEIPLLCKLGAEVLLYSDEKYLLTSLDPWRNVSLYARFITHSIKNSLAEKFDLQVSKLTNKIVLESIMNSHIQDLESMAVRKYMPLNQISTFNISTKLPQAKFGLLVDNGESVDFEHQTFAEYFFGCWLARQWRQCPKELLSEMLSHSGNEFVLQTMSWFQFEDIPLHKAVAQGDVEAVGRLLSPGTTDRGGRSALHVAAMTQGKQDEVVELLLTAGEDTNKKDAVFGSNAIKYAEYFRNWEFVEVVLKSGKKLEGTHFITDQSTAVQALLGATGQDLTNLFQFLSSLHNVKIHNIINDTGVTLLHEAAVHNSTGVIKLILENNDVVNIQAKEGKTPLYAASEFGSTEAVKMLLQFGADPNIKAVDGGTTLMFAALRGHFEIVKLILDTGVDPNIKDANGRTALMFAAFDDHLEILKLLIQKGADPNTKDVGGGTGLMIASIRGHFEIVKLILDTGVDPNIKAANGRTALMFAALDDHIEIVKLLLQKEADPNIKAADGGTALKIAALMGHLEIVKLLLQKGADPNTKPADSRTALMLAATNGHLEIVKLLLETGVDPNIKAADGWTALMGAASIGHLEIVKLLLETGADPNIKAACDMTALMGAATNGHLEIVKLLLETGVDPNIRAEDDGTALMDAATNGHLEIVKLLLKKGANPNLKDSDGRTALINAAVDDYIEVVKLLLETGVDPNLKDVDGETALMAAAINGHLETVKLLLKNGADPNIKAADSRTALMAAATNGHLEIAKLLLKKGANPNLKDIDGRTALMDAAVDNHIEIVKLLLEKGVDPNSRSADGRTALIFATFYGHLGVVKLLLKTGVDPNIKNADGMTALMFATVDNHIEIVKLLLEIGADPNTVYAHGLTALMVAAYKVHLEIVKLLLKKGADPNMKAADGRTALMGAAHNGNLEIVNLFFESGADPNIMAADGRTALIIAAADGHFEIVKVLLNNGADPNTKDANGGTALMSADHHGHIEIVKLLLDKGADPIIKA